MSNMNKSTTPNSNQATSPPSPGTPAPGELLAEFRAQVHEVVQSRMRKKVVAVRLLLPAITRLQEFYTVEQLSEVMNEEGFEITTGTLKTTMARERAKQD